MANQEFTLAAISKGENPYYSLKTPYYPGTDSILIYAGNSIKVPNVWDIISVGMVINTDGNAGNRYGRIFVRGPDGVVYALAAFKTAAIPASQSDVNLQVNQTSYVSTNTASDIEYYAGVNQFLPLIGPLGSVLIDLLDGKAGDTIQGSIVVKFKNHELGMREDNQAWYRPY